MKLTSVFVIAAVMVGCGDNDAFQAKTVPYSNKQLADIEMNIDSYSKVSIAGEQVAAASTPGESKYVACSACHGAQGGGGIGPMLTGQSADYLRGRLVSYRNGETVGAKSALMWGNAAGLSDQDITDLVEYVLTF